MSYGTPNYQGADDGFDIIRIGGNEYYKVYNDTAGKLTDGTLKVLEWFDDADSLGVYPTLGAPATDTALDQRVVVIQNILNNAVTGIADATWGFVQIMGYCPTITAATGGVTNEQYLEVLNAGTKATDDGATLTGRSFGLAKATALVDVNFAGVLFGRYVAVAAS